MDTARSPATVTATSTNRLRALVGTEQAPIIVDVRKPPDFDAAGVMIASAIRRSPDGVAAWAREFSPDPGIVVYCVRGHDVSRGVTRDLLQAGVRASYLEGGIDAWTAEGAPTIAKRPEFGVPGKRSRWVTRERPKIDRIACPWLIRRFIDPLAEFVYVPPDQVMPVARETGAVAYDIPGVTFSHDGPLCSFDAFLREFGIRDSALDDLALIVRGADTARLDLAPQAAGLLAISLGLSVNFHDDHEMLARGITVYDALYAWRRFARSEAHSWNYGKAT